LQQVKVELKDAVAGITELNLSTDQIMVFFVESISTRYPESGIAVFIDGLSDEPDRTNDVRARLAKLVGKTILLSFPQRRLSECLIRPFQPELGFWSSADESSGE
jgi:hypothetical protein